jgi:hypothetical protein
MHTRTVLNSRAHVVHGAGPNNHDETVLSVLQDSLSVAPAAHNDLSALEREWVLFHQDLRGDQRPNALDVAVVKFILSLTVADLYHGIRNRCLSHVYV